MPSEETFFFDHGLGVNAAFAGNIPRNLRYAETGLGVKLVCRDSWVKAAAEEREPVERAMNFFSELERRGSGGHRIEQADFEQVLRAFRNHRECELQQLYSGKITVGPRRKEIMPRSMAQLRYLTALREKLVVFGVGPAGTGKTYLAMAMAVSELLAGNVQRIVLTRPAREAGEALGFLPGSLEEKIMPYLRPLYDALYDMLDAEQAAVLIEKHIIEVAPLAFMRGRTLNNSFIILDEAQNTTKDQMLMFLTRMGCSSRVVVTGDPTQNDLKTGELSGLAHATATLRGIEDIEFCFFDAADVVRHALLEKIIGAYAGE
ncbi:MAG: PhoH family protein [Victivallaceae bacterium]|nr:PhoH family protein [Victivallaceae bacterium]